MLWFVVMLFPLLAVVLAARHEIAVGSDEGRQIRVFLVQETADRGVGIEWAKPARERGDCTQSAVVYLMWRGTGENTRFCTCYDGGGAVISNQPGACQAAPSS